MYSTQIIIFAWATIERHILIFHDKWVTTKKKRYLIHYIPLILLLLYCLIYYSIAYFFPPCQNKVNYFYVTVVENCIIENVIVSIYDIIVNGIAPMFLIVIISIALLLRVLWQKYRMRQPIQWRKQRKMTVQLLSISFIYIVCVFPFTLIHFLVVCGITLETTVDFRQSAVFLSYLVVLIIPFFCVLSLNELRVKLFTLLRFHRDRTRVVPVAVPVRNPLNNQRQVQ